ncbi:hypothetical protein CRI93_07415 [Longimonas halophila]|uniref:GIY-YIG domain-containing protein n=2 Tax=Longimonas halophila TaxID=1469170 RepID=A0A2H3NLD8_9BACT|nr:hypothetical protein CRI93_07415 [Longimonas halophila]
MYVGETKDLQRRFSEYLLEVDEEKGRPMIRKLLFMWKGFVKFYYIKVCQERKEEVQDSMINAFRPPYNIAMDASVGQPQKAFGP